MPENQKALGKGEGWNAEISHQSTKDDLRFYLEESLTSSKYYLGSYYVNKSRRKQNKEDGKGNLLQESGICKHLKLFVKTLITQATNWR